SGNTFLRQSAIGHNVAVPRLPVDSGQVLLAATASMSISGSVQSEAPAGGNRGWIDISSPNPIVIATSSGAPGVLLLDPNSLTAFGADSLLIGGECRAGPAGTAVTGRNSTTNIDNAPTPLCAP